ncbi:MAG: ATP-binding protein, partial [Bacteroidota bacterium]
LVLAICIVLFFYCNHLAGFPVFKDYVLVVGLIPTALGMVYFYDKLIFLENRNLKYIKELEFQQEEMLHFNHVMSHDLKAPLRSITSFTGFLSKDIQNEFVQTNQKIFNYILDASRSMAALIDELLELSKASSESYPFKEVDLNELLARVKLNLYDSLSETKAIISYEGLPIIIGNDAALLVVFQNLISNSIKYQPKDIADHFPEIELSFKREDKTLHLFIRDNGIGIPQKRINDLFQPFSRFHSSEDFSGSGLGLSICKKIMERHEGTIRLVETSSSGSCFELIFSTSLKENKDLNIG